MLFFPHRQATFDLHPMGLPPQEILDELELRRIYERLSSHYSTQKQMEPSQVNRHLAQWDSASGNCHLRNFISQQPSPPANFDSTLKLIDKAMDLTPGPIPGVSSLFKIYSSLTSSCNSSM